MLVRTSHNFAPLSTRRAHCRRLAFTCLLLGAHALGAATMPAEPAPLEVRGLPLARSYAFEEIGNVSPGLQLSTDSLGRLTAIEEGVYVVFDDKNWTDVLDKTDPNRNITKVARAPDGTMFCGEPGGWGYLEYLKNGSVRVHSLRPDSCPDWVSNTRFQRIAFTAHTVVFAGEAGAVQLDRMTGQQRFFAIPDTIALFAIGEDVFISSYRRGLCRLDARTGELIQLEETPTRGRIIEIAAPWDEHQVVAVTYEHVAVRFNGEKAERWHTEIDDLLPKGVSVILKLDGDLIAFAIKSLGLYILDGQGRIVLAPEGSRFEGITDLCLSEPGVLWVSAAEGVTKVLYRAPVSVFDHRLGLVLSWPQVLKHRGRSLIVSNGKVYDAVAGMSGEATHFQPLDIPIDDGVWNATSTPHGLLLGNNHGVYFRDDANHVEQVLTGFNVNRVLLTDPSTETYLVIGASKIAALSWRGGHWQETAERVAGVGFPSVVAAAAPRSVWIELGLNRVARVTIRDDQIHVRVYDEFPWPVKSWINLGQIGSMIILTYGEGQRLFFDETRDAFVDSPELLHLLDSAPYSALRPQQDAHGVIWVPHPHGLFRLIPNPTGGYRADVESLSMVRDSYPVVDVVDGTDVWIRTAHLLMRVDSNAPPMPSGHLQPVLTRVVDARRHQEIFSAMTPLPRALDRIPYRSNSLNFHFFPGTHALLRNPSYQFKLDGYSDTWSVPSPDTMISLTQLHEGNYRMSVRLIDGTGPIGETSTFSFSIAPPPYRTWPAYVAYVVLGLATLWFGGTWLLRRAVAANAQLEKLVQSRTQDLDKANEQLRASVVEAQQAARAKSQFLANMSHEIRTPMNGVIGMSNVLLDTSLNSEQQECAETIRNSAESLLGVLNDILDFSKIEAGKLQFECIDFDLRASVEESVDLMALRAADKPVELASLVAPALPRLVRGDPGRLRQILLNLIGNAVKFTESGEVVVTVNPEPHPPALGGISLRFEIADTGIGIAPEAQSRLFRPFTQADNSTTRRFGGTGLGLAISRQIVELMGGAIGVRSEVGKGSTFWFTIRCEAASPNATAAEPPPPAAALRGRQILIVDGSPTHQRVLEHHAGFWGMQLATAPNADEAQRMVAERRNREAPVDCIVASFSAPDTDGLAFARAIRAAAPELEPRVLLLVPVEDRRASEIVRQSGMATPLTKPIREKHLLRELLRTTGAQGDPAAAPREATPIRTAKAPPPLRILVAEDNPVNRRLVLLQLRKIGYEADYATNGREAINAIEKAAYDVVFMDCQMPELDGYQATRLLRQDPRLAQLRIIAMTANALEGDREKCLAAGMNDYLAKPLRELELRMALEAAARALV